MKFFLKTLISERAMERKRIAQQAAAPDETLSFIDYRPDLYDTMLASRCREARDLLSAHLAPSIETEVHPSPAEHYRQRLGLGVYDAKHGRSMYRKTLSPEQEAALEPSQDG